jgi:ABC-type transport system involved in multi-copper enzyme maturation permease subunit
MSIAGNMFRGPWTIARYTFREGIRKKTLVGFLILSLLVIFGASFMGAFLNPSVTGPIETDIDLKLIKDICVTTISIFGILITIFISASVVPAEMENKVIYTVLSKPVRRLQYLLGKFVGVQLIVLVNLLLMGGLFFVMLYIRQGIMPTLLLWSVALTYFEFLIVSAFTFAVSCASTSAVLPTIAGLFIWITGSLTEYLKDVHARSMQSVESIDQAIGYIALGLWNILPNLQNFNLKMEIIERAPNDLPANMALIPNLVVYGLVYALSGFVLSYWIFRRKEL